MNIHIRSKREESIDEKMVDAVIAVRMAVDS